MSSLFHDTRVFGRRRECRLYTACCVHKMAVSAAGYATIRVGQTGDAG